MYHNCLDQDALWKDLNKTNDTNKYDFERLENLMIKPVVKKKLNNIKDKDARTPKKTKAENKVNYD